MWMQPVARPQSLSTSATVYKTVEWYEARANSIMLIILSRPTQRIGLLIMSTAIGRGLYTIWYIIRMAPLLKLYWGGII